jgi:hypothetical protein
VQKRLHHLADLRYAGDRILTQARDLTGRTAGRDDGERQLQKLSNRDEAQTDIANTLLRSMAPQSELGLATSQLFVIELIQKHPI